MKRQTTGPGLFPDGVKESIARDLDRVLTAPRHYDGKTFDPECDNDRLDTLLKRVYRLMKDGRWRTLAAIQDACGGSEASVSARLRDLRKTTFGCYPVERRRVGAREDGLFEYRVVR